MEDFRIRKERRVGQNEFTNKEQIIYTYWRTRNYKIKLKIIKKNNNKQNKSFNHRAETIVSELKLQNQCDNYYIRTKLQ